MTTIVYIHGFLSSPQSYKARYSQEWLKETRPDIHFYCPALSSYPKLARQTLHALLEEIKVAHPNKPVYIIGSSLGGYWATYLVETGEAEKAVLVNPSVAPQDRFIEFKGQTLKSFYSDETFCLGEEDYRELCACDFPEIKRPLSYWLMAQKGDETLDYRQAEQKYHHCKQLIEEGGSHTFEGYETWLPEIIEFFET